MTIAEFLTEFSEAAVGLRGTGRVSDSLKACHPEQAALVSALSKDL